MTDPISSAGGTARPDARELPALLQRLHAELAGSTTLDAESRRLLGVVLEDIRRLEPDRLAATAAEAPTPGGLEALAVRFEAEHPSLAASLRQIADVLGKAGI
ncbi:MAG: DUF4404 family protein [Steroidobacteraceae bacterium]|jgi:hypothetical protein|nr:DUF4404 family protein [Steroidobacteraceae bacterium]